MLPRLLACGVLLGVLFFPAPRAGAEGPSRLRVFQRRGVYFFEGPFRSPLAGLGSRGEFASNRVAIDDRHSRVTWDAHGRKLVFRNTHEYDDETLVGDVLLLGTGTTETGRTVPVGVRLNIYKDEDEFEPSVFAHVTVDEPIPRADFFGIQVVLDNGRERTVALTKSIGLRAVRSPFSDSMLATIIGLKGVNNLEGEQVDISRPGAPLADGSVGLGRSFLSKLVLRARLITLDGCQPVDPGGDWAKVLQTGGYELRLTALSSLLPRDLFARDLFLMGLDELPLLQGVRRTGLPDGETLAFVFRDGQGTIRLGKRSQPVPNAPDIVRRYLEFDFVGAIIRHQLQMRLTGQLPEDEE